MKLPWQLGSLLVVLLLALAPAAAAAPEWYPLGTSASPINFDEGADATLPSLADVGGKPHLVWNEGTIRAGRLDGPPAVAEPWTALGASPMGTAADDNVKPDIASIGGVPYAAWSQGDGTNSEVRVARFDSGTGTWQEVGGANSINISPTQDGLEPVITGVGAGGVPHVAWRESDGANLQIRVKRFNSGTNLWEPVGPGPAGAGFAPDIVDLGGVPYVTFTTELGPTDIRVRRYDSGGNSWVAAGTDGLISDYAGAAQESQLANIGGFLFVTWFELGPVFRVHVKRFNGTSWFPPVASDQSLNHDDNRHATQPSIASVGGVAHVAWAEQDGTNDEIRVSRFNTSGSGSWEELDGGDPANPINRSPTLGVPGGTGPDISSRDGRPVVAWAEIDAPPGGEGSSNPTANTQIFAAEYGEPDVPQNTGPPVMSGVPQPGNTMTCVPGTFTGATTVVNQFVRSVGGGPFNPINGSEGTTIGVAAADIGNRIACRTTATNGQGSTAVLSNFMTIAAGAPVNVSPPVIGGTPTQGAQLECNHGNWNNGALSFSVRWLADGQPIPGASGSTYVLTPSDTNKHVTCEETASNDVGQSAPSTSASAFAVNDIPRPFSSAAPRPNLITRDEGAPAGALNNRIRCVGTVWANDPDHDGHAFRIERASGGVVANGRTYDITIQDLGVEFVCIEIVTNAKGSNELRSVVRVAPLPEETTGSVKLLKAGGFNRFDPVNLMASPEMLNVALAPAQTERVLNGLEDFMPRCSRIPLPSGLPGVHPSRQTNATTRTRDTCRLLVNGPAENIHIFSTGVRVYDESTVCIFGDNDPCGILPIPMKEATRTNQPVSPDLVPERVLWDLDSNGTTDISCPGSSPVARSIFRVGWYKVRAVLVLPDSAETGYFPSVTEWFDHHSPLPPTPEIPEYKPEPFNFLTQILSPVLTSPAFDLNPALNLNFNFAKLAAAQPRPPSGIEPGVVRKGQPMWCWNTLEPPEVKEAPCASRGQIGQVTVEGNICPISLRRFPEAEIATMERTDPELYNLLVAHNNSLGAARLRAKRITKSQTAFTPIQVYDETTQEFASYVPDATKYGGSVREAASLAKVSPQELPGIFDSTAIIQGNAKINGVLVEAPRTLVLPSEVGELANTVKKMRLFSSEAIPSIGGLPVGDPAKGLNAAIDEAMDAGAQALVKEFNLDALADSGVERVRELAKKLDLGPFKLAGDVDVKLENGAAIVTAQAQLPLLNNIRAGVTFRATPDGNVQFEGLKIDVGNAKLGALSLKNVLVEYFPATGLLLKGQVTFPWAGGAGIEIVEFRVDNRGNVTAMGLNYLAGAGTGIPIGAVPGVFLTKIGATVRNTPELQEFQADAAISVATSVGDGCPSLGADGTMLIHFGKPPFFVSGNMALTVVCLGLADVNFKVLQSGRAEVTAHMGFEGGPLFFNGTISGDVEIPNWQMKADISGGVRLPVIPDIEGKLSGVISNRGMAACGTVPIVDVDMGAGIRWTPSLLAGPLGILSNIRIFDSCDLSGYETVKRASLTGAQDGNARTVGVEKGERGLVLSAEGLGAAPKAVLRGPDGTVLDLTGEDAGVQTDRAFAVRVEDEDRSVFVVKAPAAGDWKLEPSADSVQIVQVKRAGFLPKPKVSAKVVRKGSAYELRWSVAKLEGQVVRFVEQAESGGQDLLTVRGGGSGVKRFVPSASTKAGRVIVAQVEQDGLPRASIDVLKFSAPSPRVGRPGKLRARRRGKGAIVTWSPAFYADRYEVTVSTSRGDRKLYLATKGKRQITIKRLSTRDTLTARVVGVSRDGLTGPAGTVRLARPKAKRRR